MISVYYSNNFTFFSQWRHIWLSLGNISRKKISYKRVKRNLWHNITCRVFLYIWNESDIPCSECCVRIFIYSDMLVKFLWYSDVSFIMWEYKILWSISSLHSIFHKEKFQWHSRWHGKNCLMERTIYLIILLMVL